MAAVAQATKSTITIKGSTQICTEFFGYSINSVLYQRGLYPSEYFTNVKKYGLQMMVTTNPTLSNYLAQVLAQLSSWLQSGTVQKLILVITNLDTNIPVERWTFNIESDKETITLGKTQEKGEKEITKEIAAIIRQITSSVSFLPLLDFPCSFDLLVYTDSDILVPSQWEESDPRYIANANEVRLRSFTTKIHKVETLVAYRVDE